MTKFTLRSLALLGILLAPAIQQRVAAEEKPLSHLEMVPADAPGFASISFKGVWDDEIIKELQKQLAATPGTPNVFGELEKKLGFSLKELDRVTFIFPAGPDESPVGIITALKPLDRTKVQAAMVKKGKEMKTESGKAYFGDESTVVCFLSDTTVIIGDTKPTLAYLEKKPDPKKESRFKGAAELLAKNTLVVIADLAPYSKGFEKMLSQLEGTAPLLLAKPALLTVIAGEETAVDLKLTFAKEKEAKDAEKAAQSAFEQLSKHIADGQKQLSKALDDPKTKDNALAQWGLQRIVKILQSVEESVKKAEVTRKSQDVHVSLHAKMTAVEGVLMPLMWIVPVRKEGTNPPPEEGGKTSPPPEKGKAPVPPASGKGE